jgi:hypothetical protein
MVLSVVNIVTVESVVSQVVCNQCYIAVLPARCYLKTGPVQFLELLITCYEPAARGVYKIKLYIVEVISGRFN